MSTYASEGRGVISLVTVRLLWRGATALEPEFLGFPSGSAAVRVCPFGAISDVLTLVEHDPGLAGALGGGLDQVGLHAEGGGGLSAGLRRPRFQVHAEPVRDGR